MKPIKRLIKRALLATGWELTNADISRRKILARATMEGALKWIADQQIPVNTVLDVGASNGCWTELCMVAVPAKDFVLFEPQPVHSAALEAFKEKHGGKIHIVSKAVGATEGQTFFDASEPLGGALGQAAGERMIEVPMTTMDKAVESLNVRGPFLLKLDTHGYEPSILKGAERTLENCSVLIIEAYNFHISGEAILFWELCTFLAKRGFRCADLVDVLHRVSDSALWQMDLVFIKDDWAGFSKNTYT